MTKEEILSEIKRAARANGGLPLGLRTFERETGIRHADWFGIHWRSWGDAVREAGLQPNTLTPRIDEEQLLRRYCELTRELQRGPTKGDLRLKKRSDPSFPSDVALVRRFGSYPGVRARAYDHCTTHEEFSDLLSFLQPRPGTRALPQDSPHHVGSEGHRAQTGYVYLVRHGTRAQYKIGKTFNPIRREGEIRLQLPERLTPIHYIETDDPAGVEAYWHTRFKTKELEGEWFALSRDDVAAFKRWRRLV